LPDRLTEYRRKRDFECTPEPSGSRKRKPPANSDPKPKPRARTRKPRQPRFVVHEHHARRLHWDLRLEHDGALASWAVPNGIPDDPKRNRKAIHTEDHPLSYLDFEGEIPRGEYGAGTIAIWDQGTYEPEKFRDDEVIAVFHGERLRGRYALFQTDGRDWMIHRMDPSADPEGEPMPERLVPMMARSGQLPADDENWAYEVKWDGVRALLYWEPGALRLESRNLNDISVSYPEVRPLGRELGSRRAVLDGELVAFDDAGRPSFGRLQQRMHLSSESAARRRAREVPVTYVIFDVLYLDGRLLCDLPYVERRGHLEQLRLDGPAWRTPAHHTGDGAAILEASARQGLEGIVAKRLDSRYESGRRSGTWLKVKHTRSQELVIGGWAPGQGRRRDRIGALLVGHYDITAEQAAERDEPQRLVYAGKVGTGFTERELDRLSARLEPLRQPRSPFARRASRTGVGPPRGSVFVEPELVAEVEFRDWTSDGCLRAPSYKGLRADRDPREVVREDVAAAEAGGDSGGLRVRPVRRVRGGEEVEVDSRSLKLTNLDKVLYPATGFTKGDLIDYYSRVADVLLPHLHDRPLTLKRYPDGVEGEYFYEKQCPSHRPDWVAVASIPSRGKERDIDYCLANDLPTLVWLGNLADLELHTSLSLADRIERPTMLVFDLDPGPPAGVLECAEVALWLRGLFAHLDLETLVKTSGSKGLQAYVPLNAPVTYGDTKPFAKAVADLLAKQNPDRVVSRMTKQLRRGKVFVDWSQNDEHKTTVSVYSPRALDRPTVSTPLEWEEVEAAVGEGRAERLTFDTEQVLERVAQRGDLFAPALTLTQELPRLE
jgi:bifunctional non-homologous end joining protein LigD